MKIAFSVAALTSFAIVCASSARADDNPSKPPLQGGVETHKRHHAKESPSLPALPPGGVRRVNIQQAPVKSKNNPFQSISDSLPAAAVKEDLRRKNELPSAQTAILTPGAKVGGGPSPSASMPGGTTGASPKILNPNGQAVNRPGTPANSR